MTPAKIAHQLTDDGVTIVLRPGVGTPSSIRVTADEAKRFGWALLADVDPDGDISSPAEISFGPITVHPEIGRCEVDGRAVRLTKSEIDVLACLIRSAERVVSKPVIFASLYACRGDDEPELKIIDVFVCKLRQKLHPLGCDELIETIWGRGYMLTLNPTPGPRGKNPAARKLNTIQSIIVDRLTLGEATFQQLADMNSAWAIPSVRGTLHRLMRNRIVENVGSYRRAVYRLVASQRRSPPSISVAA